MTKQETLDAVGQRIVTFVRDGAISRYDQIESGFAKPGEYQILHMRLRALSAEGRALAREMAVRAVDLTLHNFLWMLEGGEKLELFLKTPSGERVNVTELSDGLSVDMHDWIRRFSKYPPSIGT